MITIEKTQGVRAVANDVTFFRLQEVIAGSIEQYGWVGKAVIDTEKITFYKFGLKLGIARHSTNGFVVNEYGEIRDVGLLVLCICDHQVLKDLYKLFGEQCPIKC